MLSESRGRSAMLWFSYQIILGGGTGQALVSGSVYIADVESAKRHVQTVTAPGANIVGRSDLDVILRDSTGSEIWRGPYLGETAT
jgi:predicted acyltransferase